MVDKTVKSRPAMRRLIDLFFNQQLDLRVRLFNVLVTVSGIFCIIITLTAFFANFGIINVIVDAGAAVFCFGLLIYSSRSGRYRICQIIFIIGSFFILFPFLFFITGGYFGGLVSFFVFAPVFTVFMLEGKTAITVTALEIILYIGLCIYAFYNPDSVAGSHTELGLLLSNIMCMTIVGVSLGATMHAQIRLYNAQQRQLDEQNAVLAQANRAKTEFLANASHEMRTPLTVTSVNVQVVMRMLEDMGENLSDPEARELLEKAQSEIMRLSRMVGGMLTLASMSEDTDRHKLDYTALLHSGVEMLRLTLAEQGIMLETNIEDELTVFGNADLLAQVLANLLQNARAHTKNGTVTVNAEKQGAVITVTVRDTGSGIPREILPHVFERGVSTSGTGFGLFLCKMVVESHGGSIWIESGQGEGTAVFFSLPVYEGQIGG